MELDKRRLYGIFFLCLLGTYLLAWIMQAHLLLKDDVAWLMHLARLVLNGGDYLRNFFETNPPLIFYLYMPTIALSQLFLINDALALRLFVFLLSTLSLYLCHALIRKIFSDRHLLMTLLFTLFLGTVFLIFPLFEFGQREHLFLILSFPYFLLTAYRLENPRHSIKLFFALSIGIMAGIGFAIKPFFLLPLAAVEIYYFYHACHTRKLLAAGSRPEMLTIIVFFLLYADFLLGFYKSYFFSIVPLVAEFYYQTISHPWRTVLLNGFVLYLAAVVALYCCVSRKNTYRPLLMVLLLVLVGNFLGYAIQKLAWYYHLLPALAFALILQFLLFCLFFTKPENLGKTKNLSSLPLISVVFPFLLSLGILLTPIYFIIHLYSLGQHEKNSLSPIITYLHQHQHNKPLYVLSPIRAYMTFALDHRHEQQYPRLEYLGWMRGYLKGLKNIPHEDFFVKMIAEDLNKNKPPLVLVDQTTNNILLGSRRLDCLRVLTQHHDFRLAWAPYRYSTTLLQPAVYKFDVYERF